MRLHPHGIKGIPRARVLVPGKKGKICSSTYQNTVAYMKKTNIEGANNKVICFISAFCHPVTRPKSAKLRL